MDIYIDVSELVTLKYMSGIQRVVKEVLAVWLKEHAKTVHPMAYDYRAECFKIYDSYAFGERLSGGKDQGEHQMGRRGGSRVSRATAARRLRNCRVIAVKRINEFAIGDIFFDMDSTWCSHLKRSWLLPRLKANGVKIATHIYDIIPITMPQFCHEFTVVSFIEYLGAHIEYSDLMIANAAATIDDLAAIMEDSGHSLPRTAVVQLGADFSRSSSAKAVRSNIRNIADGRKYLLMVGTLEPRKNHAFALKAFEERLFDMGLSLVFAGREGWHMEEFATRIKDHPMAGDKFFHIEDASDAEIAFLYENAYMVLFPSFGEGFGLPIIEAFSYGVPVVAADIPILKEVGKEYCDYYAFDNIDELSNIVEGYINNPDKYQKIRGKIGKYKPRSWREAADDMYRAIEGIEE